MSVPKKYNGTMSTRLPCCFRVFYDYPSWRTVGSPFVMYGAEILGIEYQHAVEKVHYYACKHYMCVRLNSSNDAILGECGRFPLYIQYYKRCINFWLKILRMPEDRYVKKCYFMLKCYDEAGISNWASAIRKMLYTNGFGYVWESQSVVNEKHFLALFIQRLKDHIDKIGSQGSI